MHGQVDVWAVGVSAIEMAEGSPPRWRVHPMRVIFLIGREPPPALAERDRWSLTLHDFIAQCLQKVGGLHATCKRAGHRMRQQCRCNAVLAAARLYLLWNGTPVLMSKLESPCVGLICSCA